MVMEQQEHRLVTLLSAQKACYQRLRRLADRQRLLVSADDAPGLLALLSERQQCLEELSRLSGDLSPYRETWTRVYRELSDPVKREVKTLLDESNSLLSSVMASDRQDSDALSARRELTAAALTQTRSAGAAAAAYARSMAGAGGSSGLSELQA